MASRVDALLARFKTGQRRALQVQADARQEREDKLAKADAGGWWVRVGRRPIVLEDAQHAAARVAASQQIGRQWQWSVECGVASDGCVCLTESQVGRSGPQRHQMEVAAAVAGAQAQET